MKKIWISLLLLAGVASAQVPLNGSRVDIKGNTVIPGTTTGPHGNGVDIQYSDGTGLPGNTAVFDSNGNVTDGGSLVCTNLASPGISRGAGVTYQNTQPALLHISGSFLTSGSSVGNVAVFMGPTSGSLTYVPWANQSTATVSGGDAGFVADIPPGWFYQVVRSNSVSTTLHYWNEVYCTNSISGGGGGGGGGSVTYVGLAAPVSLFTVANSPVTTNGTLTLNYAAIPAHYTLVGTGSSGTIRQLTLDDIAPAFAITSFTCSTCGTYELGATIASPTNFTASYTSTPTSASIGDGTNTATLTTPFTSGSLAFSYTAASSPVVFTLTAIGATTQTGTAGIFGVAASFAGTGTAGATGATASGTNATLAGATGTLTRAGLGNQASYTVTASAQKIYILMQGGSHTFSLGGFSVPMNPSTAITFINQYGQSVSEYLYETVNLVSGTSLALQVTS